MAQSRPRYILLLLVGFVAVTAIVIARRQGSPPPASPPPGPASAEFEPPIDPLVGQLMADIESYPVGEQTLAALAFPRSFLLRVADRVIRASYRERFHSVYRDDRARAETAPPTPVAAVRASPGAITFVPTSMPPAVLERRRAQPEERPVNRGFRAPILDDALAPRTPLIDLAALTDAERTAAGIIGTRLARDGLLATLADVLGHLASEPAPADGRVAQLERIGFPVDLLRHFGDGTAASTLAAIEAEVVSGARSAASDEVLPARLFRFAKTSASFAAAPDSGAGPTAWMRGQLTRGVYWKGIGAGGCLDVMRQLAEALPDVPCTLSVEAPFEEDLAVTMQAWPVRASWEVLLEPLPVAQWGQDNAKMGAVADANGPRPAMLVPRFASRREDGSVFIPGETSLLDGVAARGHTVLHSPLIFQGGNLLCVEDPGRGERVLLIGEAEIYRNTALGLTEAQVIEAFAVEMAVDRCLVLPSISFHIDYDVSLRVHDGAVVVFVNDTDAAVRAILRAGIGALRSAGVLDPTASNAALRRLEDGDDRGVLDLIAGPVFGQADRAQRYPLSLAEYFAVDAVDSPVGNLQRFLAALDILVSKVMAGTPNPNPTTEAYLRSYRRSEADRQRLHGVLRNLGWTVVPVPSLAEADRSINAINGVHLEDRYLMPAYGGFYAGLDAAAAHAIGQTLGEQVDVIAILSGESQRRSGAVHCSVGVCPDPRSWYAGAESSGRADPRWDDLRSRRASPASTPP